MRRRLTVAETLGEVRGKLVWNTPKSHAAREVPIPASLVNLLAELTAGKSPDELVFTTWRGRPLRNLNFRRDVFDRAALDAGLEGLTPHDLRRHTAVSLAVSTGANLKAIQAMLGHASATMTLDTYSHLFNADLDAVAERPDAGWRPEGARPNDATVINFQKRP
jgi:integrase